MGAQVSFPHLFISQYYTCIYVAYLCKESDEVL